MNTNMKYLFLFLMLTTTILYSQSNKTLIQSKVVSYVKKNLRMPETFSLKAFEIGIQTKGYTLTDQKLVDEYEKKTADKKEQEDNLKYQTDRLTKFLDDSVKLTILIKNLNIEVRDELIKMKAFDCYAKIKSIPDNELIKDLEILECKYIGDVKSIRFLSSKQVLNIIQNDPPSRINAFLIECGFNKIDTVRLILSNKNSYDSLYNMILDEYTVKQKSNSYQMVSLKSQILSIKKNIKKYESLSFPNVKPTETIYDGIITYTNKGPNGFGEIKEWYNEKTFSFRLKDNIISIY